MNTRSTNNLNNNNTEDYIKKKDEYSNEGGGGNLSDRRKSGGRASFVKKLIFKQHSVSQSHDGSFNTTTYNSLSNTALAGSFESLTELNDYNPTGQQQQQQQQQQGMNSRNVHR
eukprot:Pgem_evm1s12504